ncbi:TLC domain-containing protein 2-like [Patiria miniata]|uniref:TLC domain-containing protein n=1 Tax=Patiria miniata TaxID=46514 RepID=A0A913ZYT6_PATMI|nr:TLC domain-containing protein 2-like [Patiria miniata]
MIRSYIPISVASAFGFQCVNFLFNYDLPLIPSPVGKFADKERYRWRNAGTALVSDFIISGIVIYCLYSQPGLWSDPVRHYAVSVEVCFAVLSGFYMHETYDLLTHNPLFKDWLLVFHHGIVISTFFMMSIEHIAMGILTINLLNEVNAIFLHSRKLLLMHGVSKHSFSYGVHVLLNLGTFFVLRLIPLAFAVYHSFTQPMPYYLEIVMPCMTTGVAIVDVLQLWSLIRSDLLSKARDGKD